MDAGGAVTAFDAGGGESYSRSTPRLRAVLATPAQTVEPFHETSGRFGASRRTNWAAIGIIAGLHAALLAGLVTMDVVSLKLPLVEPMMVSLVPAAPPPPPPEPVFEPQLEVVTPVIVPPTLDIVPPRPSPIQAVVAETPPVAAPVAVAPAPKPAAQGAGAAVTDLSTSMISAAPPRYPLESRRRKEEGTVTLLVTVSPKGDVADIEVSRSSGFTRLDKAALSAVKKWRWSPTVRNGIAVSVRGIVEIPFVLKKS